MEAVTLELGVLVLAAVVPSKGAKFHLAFLPIRPQRVRKLSIPYPRFC